MPFRLCARPAWPEVRRRSGDLESEMAGTGRGGKTVPLGRQEPISCNTERCVMVEPAPVAAFKVAQPQLLLQLLIIPFDNPAVFSHFDQSFYSDTTLGLSAGGRSPPPNDRSSLLPYHHRVCCPRSRSAARSIIHDRRPAPLGAGAHRRPRISAPMGHGCPCTIVF
jgi:hypothetical protein